MAKTSEQLAKCREDVASLTRQYVEMVTQDTRVVTGAEPLEEATAVALMPPTARAIYCGKREERKAPSTATSATARTVESSTYASSLGATGGLRVTVPPASASPPLGSKGLKAPPRQAVTSDRERKRGRLSLADSFVEAYEAHRRHAEGGPAPTDVVTGMISAAEYRRMPGVGHDIVRKIASGTYFSGRGQLPDLTDDELRRLPQAMIRDPDWKHEFWKKTTLRRGEIYHVAGRFWYLRNDYGRYEFNHWDERLPAFIRSSGRRRDSSGHSPRGRKDNRDRDYRR